MKNTFRILFYLKKNEPKKDGTVTIMARITVDGTTKQFSTKKTIHPEDWDVKSGRAVNKSGKNGSPEPPTSSWDRLPVPKFPFPV